jgi:multiple sugar transport system substrate-binding protein
MAAALAAGVTALASGGAASAAKNAHAAIPGNATKGTITWWSSPISVGTSDLRTVWVAAFEKAYPGITVKLEAAPTNTDTNRATLETQISGGSGPDVFMGDVIWPAQFGAHQLALPLSKYLPASYWKAFAPGLVQGATYKGQVYGSPLFEDQGFLYYRKDLLAKDHLPVPTTWSQLATEAKEIQSKGQAKYGYVFEGADYEGATCDFMEFLGDAGGSVLNAAGTGISPTFQSAAVKALTQESAFVKDGISPSAEDTYQEPQAMNEFDAGQAAFLRNWDYAYSTSQATGTSVIGKVGVAPLPSFSGGAGYSNIGGWNMYINPHSKNIAADLTFIKWLAGVQAQTIQSTGKFSEIPTITAVRDSAKVKAGNAVLKIVPETKLIPRPAGTPNYSAVSQAIYQNVSAVLSGSKTPSAAVSSMISGIKTALGGGGL